MAISVSKDEYIRYFDSQESNIKAFCNIDKRAIDKADKTLFAVKDNIAVKGMELSAGSNMLKGFISPYSAFVIQKLQNAGYEVLGKTNMDEFGLGFSTESSAFGPSKNPWDISISADGGAAAVAAGLVPFALGSDGAGSLLKASAFCAVTGFRPTQGAVSRYGLVTAVPGMETIGIIATSVKTAQSVFTKIRGADAMDNLSTDWPQRHSNKKPGNSVIGIIKLESLCKGLKSSFNMPAMELCSKEIIAGYKNIIDNFRSLGFAIEEVELASLSFAPEAHNIIASAQASSGLARYDGLRYGFRSKEAENYDELICNTRGQGFGSEAIIKILLGTHILDQEGKNKLYYKAEKIRSLIKEEYTIAFSECDALLTPVYPFLSASQIPEEYKSHIAYDFLAQGPSLAGIPAIVFQTGALGEAGSVKGSSKAFPLSAMLSGPAFSDEELMAIAGIYEKANPPSHPAGFKNMWELL